jgi:uncharacterized protein YvpB
MEYGIVLDVYEGSYESDEAEFARGNVIGLIIRINDIADKMRLDTNFIKQWNESKSFNPVPYFNYDPTVSAMENFGFLFQHMPKCPAVAIDTETRNSALTPEAYGIQYWKFIDMCKLFWKVIIYTGAGFLDAITPWRTDVDYWWAQYPSSMYPSQRMSISWVQLKALMDALPDMPPNLGSFKGPIKLWQVSGDRLIVPGTTRAMDISKFLGNKSDYAKWLGYDTMNEPETIMPNTLQVPFVSQVTPGAQEHNNDCGAASVLMVLRSYHLGITETVDQIYNEIQPSGDSSLSIGGLQRTLANRLVTNEYKTNVQLQDLYAQLVANKPAIALIHYGALVDAGLTEFKGFRGAHFIVVIGMDVKYVYIHDPYSVTKGNILEVPIAVFKQALAQCNLDANPINTCIFMIPPIGDLTPIQPTGVKYNWGKDPATGNIVQAVNVRTGPAITYPVAKVLYRSATPITITQIQGDYAQLLDKSGWVYIAYFTKA